MQFTHLFFLCRIQKRLESGQIERTKLCAKETDIDVLERRQKQIDYGHSTPEYANYRRHVPQCVYAASWDSFVFSLILLADSVPKHCNCAFKKLFQILLICLFLYVLVVD